MDDRTICSVTELSLALRTIADKIIIIPANGKYLKRTSQNVRGGKGSDTTLDYYYVQLINDTLKAFEPSAEFSFEDDCVAVRLAA